MDTENQFIHRLTLSVAMNNSGVCPHSRTTFLFWHKGGL